MRKGAPPSLEPQGEKRALRARRPANDLSSLLGAHVTEDDLQEGEEGELPADPAALPQYDIEALNSLGAILADSRKCAIEARHNSGIEDCWIEDEEAYAGIDDANRAEEHVSGGYSARYVKPRTTAATPINAGEDSKTTSTRSNAYLCITASYVDGAAARTSDMLLPSDDQPWGIQPTPIPDLVRASKSKTAVPTMIDGQPADLRKIAQEVMKIAREKSEAAQTEIEDWLVECQWHREARASIEDAARLGTGILKGPVPMKRKHQAWTRGPDGRVKLDIQEVIRPGTVHVSPWNFYPDGLCGENIHKGSHTWERDDTTAKALLDLRGQPGYIDEQIEACIDEGPMLPEVSEPSRPENFSDKTAYEIWYHYGFLTRDQMEAAGCDCALFQEDPYAMIPAIVTMVNNRVIKAVLNPLDTGEFPYDVMVWKRRRNLP
ncbi:MAG TPA: hypothetical protein VD867_10770, partial [Burkholderiales bacterium]|nr:hypothetical protein [Burkholderiales bacterium]